MVLHQTNFPVFIFLSGRINCRIMSIIYNNTHYPRNADPLF